MNFPKKGIAKTFFAVVLLAGLTLDFTPAQTYVPSTSVLNWVPGLVYDDGTPLDETAIEKYDLYCNGAHVLSLSNDFTRTYTVSVDLLGAGTHTCALSETVGGLESIVSNTVSFSLGQRRPSAPTLTVSPGA